jgi:manganese efflux pump family protein
VQAAIKIVVIAISLALDVFAVSVGVGIRGGLSRAEKIRIGIAFASAEIVMNLVGMALGEAAGQLLGTSAGYVGFVALICVGVYMMIEARRDLEDRDPGTMARGWGLAIASLAISLDSLGIGFSILYIGVPLLVSLTTIFVVSIGATTLGLALGRALGKRVEESAEFLGGLLLAITGAAFVALKALNVG